ncbi:ankyrin repeat domain-containing protein [Verrucomicrobia bacterium]|nr:ankyrin repeat domain-containing protein [Verrucomicrobiota bacterium]
MIPHQQEVAELLIAKGADVNAKIKYGVTLLHFAPVYGRKETVEFLIARGAAV